MPVVIKLRGMPWTATTRDILQFFRDSRLSEDDVYIAPGEDGRACGIGFACFHDDEDARRAMQRNGAYIGKRYVELFLSSNSEMEKALKNGIPRNTSTDVQSRNRMQRQRSRSPIDHARSTRRNEHFTAERQHNRGNTTALMSVQTSASFLSARGEHRVGNNHDKRVVVNNEDFRRIGGQFRDTRQNRGDMGTSADPRNMGLIRGKQPVRGGHDRGGVTNRGTRGTTRGDSPVRQGTMGGRRDGEKRNQSMDERFSRRENSGLEARETHRDHYHNSRDHYDQGSHRGGKRNHVGTRDDTRHGGSMGGGNNQLPRDHGDNQQTRTWNKPLDQHSSKSHTGTNFFLKLTDLPFIATDTDILEFFRGINIIAVHIIPNKSGKFVGKPSGNAFIECATESDYSQALAKSGQYLGKRYITVQKSSFEEIVATLDIDLSLLSQQLSTDFKNPGIRQHRRSQGSGAFPSNTLPKDGPGGKTAINLVAASANINLGDVKDGCVVGLRNLPTQTTSDDIFYYFRGYRAIPDSVRIHYLDVNECSGDAMITLVNNEEAKQAIRQLSGKMIGNRKIELFLL